MKKVNDLDIALIGSSSSYLKIVEYCHLSSVSLASKIVARNPWREVLQIYSGHHIKERMLHSSACETFKFTNNAK
jgi:hypothetical protein